MNERSETTNLLPACRKCNIPTSSISLYSMLNIRVNLGPNLIVNILRAFVLLEMSWLDSLGVQLVQLLEANAFGLGVEEPA